MKHAVVVLAAMLGAGAVQAADLLEIYRDATLSDTKFASARMQLEAGREKYPQARAGLLPTLTLSGSSTYNHVNATLPAEREYAFNSNTYTLQLVQPLFRWQNWVALRQGELQVGLAEAQYAAAQMDLMLRSAQAYFDLLNAQDVLNTVTQLKTAAGEQQQLSKKSFEVGTVTVTDVNDAQSRFDLASAQEIAAQNDVNVKREALRVLINKEPPELARLRQGMSLAQPLPADVEAWAQAAVKDNLDVQAQQIAREIAAREVERNRAGHLPTVDAVGTYSRNHSGNGSNNTPSQSRNWTVGVQASLPLFQGGATQSKVRESAALSEKSKEDLETVKRAASQLARQSYLGVTSGVAQVKGYEAAVLSSTSSLESNKLGYQVGVKINKDVLDAQSQLADAAQKLAKARYDTIMAQVKLKQSVGVLSIKDLEEVNALLDR
ncbi:TolC family outer membrane protein [Uliginosibacterium flavum]|uniref:TolC family outer membrane protein n=1 Tax=Uliginosibacterium flavum TaxID=1396831 RepID=A0ABV2TGY4_9RHOO